MTKEELSMQINHKDDIIRTIMVDQKNYFKVGEVYDNRDKAESWQDGSSTMSFTSELELDGYYQYVLRCSNVPCHKADYENEDECEILNCEGCENEGEVLVPSTTKMKIVSITTDDDYEEMGYYEVELELIK